MCRLLEVASRGEGEAPRSCSSAERSIEGLHRIPTWQSRRTSDDRPEWRTVNQWPLVGRTAEVAAIVESLDRVPPASVVVAGPAGVGKSRVLREVADWAAAHDWDVHRIVGTRAAASIPFGAVAALLSDRLD